MALNLTTAPLRVVIRRATTRADAVNHLHHARNALRPRKAPVRQLWGASWSRPSPATEATHQPELLVHDVSNEGQLDGKPAKHVAVNIDGDPRTFDTVFLRDACTCPQCVDPDSKQKLFQTSDIPLDLEGTCQTVEDEEKGLMLEVVWQKDVPGYGPEHRTRHSFGWLQRALNTESKLRGAARHDDRVLWDKDKITKHNKWLDYRKYMADDAVLFDALTHLHRYGLLFLNNVPESEESVVKIANRIGNLKDTFYGRTWDVKSKPKAENIAYTNVFLGLHMDLLYTSNPPHLQLLHSLRARAPRGESFFSDSFHAATRLHRTKPFLFRHLCAFPVTYHYHHPDYHYHYNRPTIELYPYPKYSEPSNIAIKHVNWSPPFQGPFEARIGGENRPHLRYYLEAANAFEKLLSAEENLYEYRLEEGECVIFDNRRVLHARRAFDAQKGERWLKGAYVDDDVFYSKLRILQERYEGKWDAEGVVRRKEEPLRPRQKGPPQSEAGSSSVTESRSQAGKNDGTLHHEGPSSALYGPRALDEVTSKPKKKISLITETPATHMQAHSGEENNNIEGPSSALYGTRTLSTYINKIKTIM